MTPNDQLLHDWIDRSVDVFAMVATDAGILARDIDEQEDQRTLAAIIALFMDDDMDPMRRYQQFNRLLAQRADALEAVKDRLYRIIERFTKDEGDYVNRTVGPVQDETQSNTVLAAVVIASLANRVFQRPLKGWDQSSDDLFKEMIARDRARIEKSFAAVFGGGRGVRWLNKSLRSDFSKNGETAHIVLHAMIQHARSVTLDLAMATVGGQVRWVSVLDGKTTAICRSRSGKIYPAGSGPRPPAHVRCRSIVVPHLPGKGDPDEPAYEDWLRKQTPDRVRQILGKTKGDMFLRGELILDDMVTARGRELTLNELAGKRRN